VAAGQVPGTLPSLGGAGLSDEVGNVWVCVLCVYMFVCE
jgi:hypothetical protein